MFGTIEMRWRRLRLSLAVCAAAALAGGAAAAAAWWHENRVTEVMLAAETRLAEARGRHSALVGERKAWRRFGRLYRRLAAQGRLGTEQPEHWNEAAKRARAAVVSARHRLGAPYVVARTGPVEVRARDMMIDLEMRHEAELPVFLADLDREAPGLFTVSGCRLVRADESRAKELPPAAVGASCRIRWQSVVLSGVEPGWTPPAESREGEDNGAGAEGWRPDLADPSHEAFGRLFTTVVQRAEIESAFSARRSAAEIASSQDVAPVRPEPPPRQVRWVRVGGVMARSGGSVYAWIDGRRVAHAPSSAQSAIPARARVPAIRLDAGGRSIVVLPGERFDPMTGTVTDPIRRPLERIERDRSLRESSRAPLTDLPAPGQN